MTHVKFMNNGHTLNDAFSPKNFSKLVDSFLSETLPEYDKEFSFRPRVDIVEKEKSFEIHVLLPGLEKENVSVKVEDNKLMVSGERKQAEKAETDKYLQVESFYGKFKRSFSLPKNVDPETIKAIFKNGILEISVEKAEIAKSGKIIEIQ